MNYPLRTPICALFERLSVETWDRLFWGNRLDVSQGETTITDNNLLTMVRSGLPGLRIYKAKPPDERRDGFDWEWWIRGASRRWRRYVVQAKKLNLDRLTYDHIRHPVGGGFQIDLIEDFARNNRAIPLYSFYNSVDDQNMISSAWNCPLPLEKKQLGCTLAPLQVVRQVHERYRSKTFQSLHQDPRTIPWRCLVCCPDIVHSKGDDVLNTGDWETIDYEELPPHLGEQDDDRDVNYLVDLPLTFYESRLGGYPKRILTVDVSSEF